MLEKLPHINEHNFENKMVHLFLEGWETCSISFDRIVDPTHCFLKKPKYIMSTKSISLLSSLELPNIHKISVSNTLFKFLTQILWLVKIY